MFMEICSLHETAYRSQQRSIWLASAAVTMETKNAALNAINLPNSYVEATARTCERVTNLFIF